MSHAPESPSASSVRATSETAGPAGAVALAPSSAFVRMFKPQFAPLVESGKKCQTVRPWPKRLPKVGDRISLRAWIGKPYRSKQRVLREATIKTVASCEITQTSIRVGPFDEQLGAFAVADGFSGWDEMRQWFEQQHGLPFRGVLLVWQNAEISHDRERKI